MKKVGHFFFIFAPLILAIVIENLAVFFGMGISALIEGSWYTYSKTADFYAILDDLSNFWMDSSFNTCIMLVYAAIAIVAFGLWYYMQYDGNYLPKLRHTFHPLTFLGIIMLTPGMQFLSSYIVTFTATIFPKWLEDYEELIEYAGLDESLTLSMFLYSVIFAPFAEELIFRGVTMRQARRIFPFWAANLMQALLFGIFHMNMIQGVYAFCLGLILGYICERGGSIYHAILLHILFNFWAGVISQFIHIGDSAFEFLFWLLFGVTMTFCGILIFAIGVKKAKLPTSEDTLPEM